MRKVPIFCDLRRIITLVIACICSGPLRAGGWDRFDQGIDLLFDPGRTTFDVRLYELLPNQKFNSVNGKSESVSTAPDFFHPSVNIKFTPLNNAACLAAYRQPFGINYAYPPTWSQASITISSTLNVQELGLTCSYRAAAGDGYLRLIGGATEDFATYAQEAQRQLPNGFSVRPSINLEGSAAGYRTGLAYELPSMGVRASLMYYSNIDFSVRGALRNLPLSGNAFLGAAPVEAAASIPRAVEGIVQFPIAPTWFDTVSIKWVNWSVEKSIPVVLVAGAGPLRAGQVLTRLNIFFLDGWTLRNTVTYQWSERLALSVAVGWDRGVSTGWTDNPNAWNSFLFGNYKVTDHLELTGGVGLIRLAPAVINKRAEGGDFNATASASDIVFTQLGIRYRF
jgi:long-chain fatty acid transport protein